MSGMMVMVSGTTYTPGTESDVRSWKRDDHLRYS
jgi:hypothetical protein